MKSGKKSHSSLRGSGSQIAKQGVGVAGLVSKSKLRAGYVDVLPSDSQQFLKNSGAATSVAAGTVAVAIPPRVPSAPRERTTPRLIAKSAAPDAVSSSRSSKVEQQRAPAAAARRRSAGASKTRSPAAGASSQARDKAAKARTKVRMAKFREEFDHGHEGDGWEGEGDASGEDSGYDSETTTVTSALTDSESDDDDQDDLELPDTARDRERERIRRRTSGYSAATGAAARSRTERQAQVPQLAKPPGRRGSAGGERAREKDKGKSAAAFAVVDAAPPLLSPVSAHMEIGKRKRWPCRLFGVVNCSIADETKCLNVLLEANGLTHEDLKTKAAEVLSARVF